MKAVLFREHGGPDKLSSEELPMSKIGPQDVMIRVKACALNHLDFGSGRRVLPMSFPYSMSSAEP